MIRTEIQVLEMWFNTPAQASSLKDPGGIIRTQIRTLEIWFNTLGWTVHPTASPAAEQKRQHR